MSGSIGNYAPMSPGEARAMAQVTGQAIRTTDGGMVLPDGSYQPGAAPQAAPGSGVTGGERLQPPSPASGNFPAGGGPANWTSLLPSASGIWDTLAHWRGMLPQAGWTAPANPPTGNWPAQTASAPTGNFPVPPNTGAVGNAIGAAPSGPYNWPGNTPAAQEGTIAPGPPGVALQSLPGFTVPGATPGIGNPGVSTGSAILDQMRARGAFPSVAHAAAHYRNTHGVATAGDTDLLNQMSLAAAQQGRTFMTPGPYQGNAIASLVAPPTTSNMLAATQGRWQPTSGPNFLAGQPAYNSGLGPQY